MRKIGIIGAMHSEIEGLRAKMQIRREQTISGVCYTEGELCGKDVVVCVCGVGKVFAAIAAQTMFLRFGVEALLNTGVAGGLAEGLCVGDLVVADDVVQHDMNTTAIGDPMGLISGLNVIGMKTDEQLRRVLFAAAEAEGCRVVYGRVASGDLFVEKESDKASIKKSFDAAACEMEGAAIGQVATVNGVPFAVLRCISDGGDGMEFGRFVTLAADISIRVVCRFLEQL